MLPNASAEHYAGQQRLTASVLAAAKRMWGARPPNDFDTWLIANVDRLVALITAGQQRAVAGSDTYMTDVLDELGTPIDADATPITDSLVGVASDGRPLDSLLYGPVITAKGRIAQGASVAQAWQSGGQALLLRAATQLADASRVAIGLGIIARKGVGYTRMLNPPSCSRCAILAGRFYRWNAGFRRHPGMRLPGRTVPGGSGRWSAHRPAAVFRQSHDRTAGHAVHCLRCAGDSRRRRRQPGRQRLPRNGDGAGVRS